MDREEVDCEEIIKKFVSELPPEMLIAIRAWKEKEMNDEKGRGFTKLVFEPRIYQTSCEGNMKRLRDYFPYQTITKGGDALIKIFMNIFQKGYLRTSIDFQSWCDFWCHEVLKDYLSFLDDVLGLDGVYSKLHIIAEKMTVMFSDQANIPEANPDGTPKLGHRAFKGLKSLGQGMAQSVWTVLCCCYIIETLQTRDRSPYNSSRG